MLKVDTVQPNLSGKKFFAVLCFFLVVLMFFAQVSFAYDYHKNTIRWQQDHENRTYFDYSGASWLQADPNAFLEVSWSNDGETKTVIFQTWELAFFPTKNGYYHAKVVRGDGDIVGQEGTIISGIENETDGTIGYDGTTGNTGTDPEGGGSEPDPPGDGDNGGDDPDPPPEPTPPTQPGNFTSPTGELSVGDITVSWGSSSGGENNSVTGYRLEQRIDGNWTHISTENNTSRSIALDTSGTVEFRVRAEGSGGLNSAWRESGTFEVDCGCWFEAPAWNEYMGKIDEIRNAIPPPPNWTQVADTFYERIVPNAINDLQNMLGTAPPPPAPPSQDINIQEPSRIGQHEQIPDYADELSQSEPTMEEVPGLAESGYSKEDIENEAPVIEFREDPTGGFNIGNPLEMLPDIPTEPPIPGQVEDAGEWDHQPEQQEFQTPMPEGGEVVDVLEPPMPSGDNGGNSIPIPKENYTPPTPGDNQIDIGNYKNHPDEPDGSG